MSLQDQTKASEGSDEGGYKKRTRERAKAADRTRTRVKHGMPLSDNELRGVVVTAIGPRWVVAVGTEFWVCSVSGVVDVPHESTIVTVGDNVWIVPEAATTEQGDLSGTIVRVEERGTVLSRKAAGRAIREQVVVANVEQLAIVMSSTMPDYNKRLIDRYLIAADKGELRPLIIINKMDLFDDEFAAHVEEDLAAYSQQLHIPVLLVSARDGRGLDNVMDFLRDTSTLFAGPSGVGKSSLINSITDSRQRVGDISKKYEKGRHTTTSSLVIPLAGNGAVVDSPGIREFGIFELSKTELPFYFEEFTAYSNHCRFAPCSHTHEPGCAVKEAVENGEIDGERYDSYCTLYQEVGGGSERR